MISLLGQKWSISNKSIDGSIIDLILSNREVENREEFLNPDFEKTHDPFLMKDMEAVITRISQAKQNQDKIMIYGDYDVDGVTSAVLLQEVLSTYGISDVEVFLPHRVEDGYGLNQKYLNKFKSSDIKLLITVDNGIAAGPEVKMAKEIGLDVIVMDHHMPHKELPECLVLNPLRSDCSYPDKNLCGVGVVFKFLQAMQKEFPDIFSEGYCKWKLDLVALGTVADCVKLIGENRLFVYFGLKVLSQTKRVGLSHLINFCGIEAFKINEMDLGFRIGPRLNAAGRIDYAKKAFEAISEGEEADLVEKVFELQSLNASRQKMMAEMMLESYKLVDNTKKYICVFQENWHAGIIGLLAGSLSREFNKPVFVLCKTNEGVVGSVRAPECSLDLMTIIEECSECFMRYGGHEKAAGLLMKESKLDQFRDKLEQCFDVVEDKDLECHLELDAEIKISQIDQNFYHTLSKLGPFGVGNAEPSFVLRDMKISHIKAVGAKRDHLKMELSKDNKKISAIAFGFGKFYDQLKRGINHNIYDFAFNLQKNSWQGRDYLDLRILDIIESINS